MILVRNVFEIAPEGMKEAIQIVKEVAHLPSQARAGSRRVTTDLAGPFYTLVLEAEYDSLAAFESDFSDNGGGDDWRKWYEKLRKHVRGGRREVFSVVAAS